MKKYQFLLSGVLPINKPAGISSFDVIRKIKKIIHPHKIGHTGTLDLPAEGVLPITLNEATKAFDYLLNSHKIYRAVIQFGAYTDTDDATGEIIESFENTPTKEQVNEIIPRFIGEVDQLSPKFSALKVGGKRSYQLARNQEEVPQKMRKVMIHKIEIETFSETDKTAQLLITCGQGTYIRSIARDMGQLLNCGGYILKLTRLKSAGITLEQCVSPDELTEDNITEYLIDLNEALESLPSLELIENGDYIMNGKPLKDELFESAPLSNGLYKVLKENSLLAIIEKNDTYKYMRVFRGL